MDEKIEKPAEEVENAEVTELEEGELQDVSGGLQALLPDDNTNCGNTQCCG
jgi:hypothetical protein